MKRFSRRHSQAVLISLFSLFSLFVLSVAAADPETDDPSRPTFGQTGQIFTLKFEPTGRRFTVSFANMPLASAGPARVVVLGRQFPIEGTSKTLNINPADNSFEILDAIEPNSRIEIEVRDRFNNKTETFNIKQQGRP